MGAAAAAAEADGAVCEIGGAMAEAGWAPTAEEAALLAEGSAIVYHHDGLHEVVRLDALPKELQARADADDAADQRYVQREALRKRAPRGVKISRALAKAKGLL